MPEGAPTRDWSDATPFTETSLSNGCVREFEGFDQVAKATQELWHDPDIDLAVVRSCIDPERLAAGVKLPYSRRSLEKWAPGLIATLGTQTKAIWVLHKPDDHKRSLSVGILPRRGGIHVHGDNKKGDISAVGVTASLGIFGERVFHAQRCMPEDIYPLEAEKLRSKTIQRIGDLVLFTNFPERTVHAVSETPEWQGRSRSLVIVRNSKGRGFWHS